MSVNASFSLFAKNKKTNKYENIGWRDEKGTILPIFTGHSDYVRLIKFYFDNTKSLDEFGMEEKDCYMTWGVKDLHKIYRTEPKQKIMYLYTYFTYLIKNDSVNEDDELYYMEEDAPKFNPIITPIEYAQLLPDTKQWYIPVIYKSSYSSDENLAIKLRNICYSWIDEFEWAGDHYDTYDFNDVKIVGVAH